LGVFFYGLEKKAEEVLKHLKSFNHYVDSDRVSCYKSMSSAELPTDSIIENLLDNSQVFFSSSSWNKTQRENLTKLSSPSALF
jgi:sialic acid synthase SpsE